MRASRVNCPPTLKSGGGGNHARIKSLVCGWILSSSRPECRERRDCRVTSLMNSMTWTFTSNVSYLVWASTIVECCALTAGTTHISDEGNEYGKSAESRG